jgi:hypothetical protein
MRILKYLIGIWAAIAVYTLFSFLGGSNGLSAYNVLLDERERQLDNIRELGILNEDLQRTKNNLLYDHDTLLVHARQLGYGQENERFVRIVGLGNIINVSQTAGNVYFTQSPDFISKRTINIVAFCLGLLAFAFFFMVEFIENRTR